MGVPHPEAAGGASTSKELQQRPICACGELRAWTLCSFLPMRAACLELGQSVARSGDRGVDVGLSVGQRHEAGLQPIKKRSAG
jgi:hypothetical protein